MTFLVGAAHTQPLQNSEESVLQSASQKREQAREKLSLCYKTLEQFFLTLQKENTNSLKDTLIQIGRSTQAEWIAQMPADLDPVSARSRLQSFYRKTLLEKLSKENSIPKELAEPLCYRLSALLAPEGIASSIDFSAKAETAIAALLDLNLTFEENWNRHLQRDLAAGREYETAEEEYGKTLKKLERELRPDRFHPAYRRVPEGMTLILGGDFTLGENTGWDLDSNRTTKKVKVKLRAYYIDRYEVSNRQYLSFLNSFPPGEEMPRIPSNWTRNEDGKALPPQGKEDYPVTGVSWEDASAYARWAGKRLASEDEWEAAARGNESLIFPWGNQFESWRPNHAGVGMKSSAPVGSFRGDRSVTGCFDMAGNVMEWTSSSPDGKTVTRLRENANMVLRGGSYKRPASQASGIYRWAYPGQSTREADIGFRCVQDVHP